VTSALFDFDLLLLAGDLGWLGQMHPKHALVELGLDLVGHGLEGQRNRTAEGAVAALDDAPVLARVLLVAFRLLLAPDGQSPLAEVNAR
jgi:hypothetical protein